ncbi:MAG: hypothetical protein GC168_15060 [Candidatus Hydrogenedens sp.]|nr:hypothetical protein [Candidatus Hydrogenedens sp.]
MNSNSRVRILARIAAGALALVSVSMITSCMTAKDDAPSPEKVDNARGFKFSHALHVDAGLDDCSVCHDPAAGNPTALSTPAHDLCSVCHEIPESNTEPPEDPAEREKCSFCHTRPDYSVNTWKPKLSGELKWQHAPHLTAEIACTTCHAKLDTLTLPASPMKPFCMDCHKQQENPKLNECSVCHSEISKDAVPQFRHGQRVAHDSPQVWEQVHGREARIDPQYCNLCHDTQNRCDDCHSVTAPTNHTMAFKNRTHGMIASWDRNSCATCHEESTCLKCHQEKQPVSHRAGWGEPRNAHCANCHFPPERSGCVVCHENIDHEEAKPSPHIIGIYPPNCSVCHPGGLPNQAPHILNSTVHCVVCHK